MMDCEELFANVNDCQNVAIDAKVMNLSTNDVLIDTF